MVWLFSALAALVLVLAAVAASLWWKVLNVQRQQKLMAEQMAQERAANESKRLDFLCESVNVIARAVLDGQCPVIEGCIRLAVLLDNLSLDCDSKHRFSVVFEIYDQTRHIPSHDNWKALPRKQQLRYQQEMHKLEQQHQEAIREAMEQVRAKPFSRQSGMSLH